MKGKRKKGKRLAIILLVELLILIGLGVGYIIWKANRAVDTMQFDDTDKEQISGHRVERRGWDELRE